MRKSNILLSVIPLLILAACNGPLKGKNGVIYTTALQYNEYIINKQRNIIQLVIRFYDAGKTNDLDKADAILDTAITVTQQHITDIAGMPAWKGDSAFRDAAIGSLRLYVKTFSEDYRYIIGMQKDGIVTPEEEASYNQRMATTSRMELQADSRLRQTQLAFAEKNKIKVQPTELQNEVNQRLQQQ